MSYDIVIAGAGPAGLSAALVLGRARKRVLVADAGPPRNAAAEKINGFVTRDGTPPAEFRQIGREQLAAYPSVVYRQERVRGIAGSRGEFSIELDSGPVAARRLLLCTGMIDELPETPGYRELWGKAIFQCPYCHGWEIRDMAFGFLAPSAALLEWVPFLKGWSADVIAFTGGQFEVPDEARARLASVGVGLDERRIRRLVVGAGGHRLEAVEMEDGARVARDALFARPPQRQTDLARGAGVALDEQGFVRVNEQMETTLPGVYAAGDLTTMFQGALLGAAAGAKAAYMINHELTMELALAGAALS